MAYTSSNLPLSLVDLTPPPPPPKKNKLNHTPLPPHTTLPTTSCSQHTHIHTTFTKPQPLTLPENTHAPY